MRKLRLGQMLFLAAVVCLSTGGCKSPGVVHFAKKDGKWEAVAVDVPVSDVTGTVVQRMESRLNDK